MMKRNFTMNLVCVTILGSSSSIAAHTQPTRPHIIGIGQVEFYSTNLEATGAFYDTVFGSEGNPDNCQWGNISQVLGNFNFSSLCAGQHLRLKEAPKPPSSTLLAEVVFATDDVKAMKEYLRAKKTTIKDSGEQYFAVMDAEGHRIGFMPSSPPERRPSPIGMRIIHAGFVVHDRAAEDKFYKDVLGFHVYWHGGMKEGDDNWVDMQVPDGTDWIEYMLKVPDNATHKQLGVMNHIALGVPDIHAAQQQLIKNGWKGTEEPKIGRDGKWQLNLYDPDETRVEMMEFKPTKEPCCSPYTGPHPGP
jgi:catechol 2,3-dioxygenase-like lactoylglutathione lyase family enzyme